MAITQKRFIAVLLATLMVFLNGFSVSGYAYGATDENAEDQTIASQSVVDEDQAQEPEADAEPAQEPEVTEEQVAEEEQKTVTQEADVEEVKEVAFSQEKTVDGVKVKVTADRGVFPEGATLTVKKLNTKEAAAVEKAIGKISGEIEITKQYNFDITILDKDGNEIQPEGKANVAFMTAEVADDSLKTEVYHIGDSGKAEAMDVASKGKTATVETEGFSAYSLRFTHYSSTTNEYSLAYGKTAKLSAILETLGITGKTVQSVQKDDTATFDITRNGDDYDVTMNTATPSGEHALIVRFTDGTSATLTILVHTHNWELKRNEAGDEATLHCKEAHCPYTGTYTKKINAADVVYDGHAHAATLSGDMGDSDVNIGDIYYAAGTDVTTGGSTTAPTNAGTYTAYVTVGADQAGGNVSTTIYKTFTIKKADINFDPEAKPTYPEGVSSLTYNGQDQELYTLATAKSAKISEKTFPVQYWYSDSEANKVTDHVLTGKNAGTWTIKYQAKGDANHNDTEIKTLKIVIGQKPVIITGIVANSKTYDATTGVSFNYNNVNFGDKVTGDTLSVTATGAFADKKAGNNKTVNITGLTLGGADKDNYIISTESQKTATANIYQKTIKVHWEHPAELEYTAAEQAPEARFDFTAPAFPGSAGDGLAYTGDEVQPVIAGKAIPVGEHRAEVTSLSGTDAANYQLISGTSNVDIEYKIIPKKLTIEWTTIEKEYNAVGLEPDWSLTGFVGGENPTKTLTMAADPTALKDGEAYNAGTYKATVSLSGDKAGNYEITNPTSPFTITKAPLTVKATGWIYYGEKVESNDDIRDLDYADITGFKGDDGAEVLPKIADRTVRFNTNYQFLDDATGVNGAKYYLIPQFDTAANYEVTNEDGQLTVYPKPVTLEWIDTHAGQAAKVTDGAEYTYDGKRHVYTAEVTKDSYVKTPSGHQADDDMTVTVMLGVHRNANAKTETTEYTPYASSLSNPNYSLRQISTDGSRTPSDVATKTISFKINQLPVELSWKPSEFTYNADVQKPTVSIDNLQTNDEGTKDAAFEVTQEYEQKSTVFDEARKDKSIEAGDYTVTAADLADKNYTLVEAPKTSADYSIKPLAVTLKWNPTAREFIYNAKDQTITVEPANIPAADKELVELETSDDSVFTAKDAGQYDIIVNGLKDTDDSQKRIGNYTLKEETHPWKINQAPLTVTANNKTITYGQGPANSGVRYSGFKGSDSASVLSGSAKYSYNYAKYGKPGTYKITPYGLSDKNYKITYKQGNLKVNDKVNRIVAKGIAKGKRKGVITWNRVSGATSYTVYLAKCNTKGKKYTPKKVKTVKGTKYTTKKLKKNTFYKFYVVANTSRGAIKSYEGHFATGNKSGKATNPKKLKANKYTVKVSVGKTAKISGSVTKVQKKLKFHKQTPRVRFLSDNTAVATVSKGGVITGKAKGWTRVYVQAENGIWKTVQVYVR